MQEAIFGNAGNRSFLPEYRETGAWLQGVRRKFEERGGDSYLLNEPYEAQHAIVSGSGYQFLGNTA